MKAKTIKAKSRVSIRPPVMADCAAFIAAVKRSRPVHRSWINKKPVTRKAFAAYLKRYATDRHHGFFVIHRETGGLAGVINLNDVSRGGFQNAAVGYYVFTPFAGKGLMAEGLRLVLRHAFKKLKLHRVEASIQPQNRASLALAKKRGFVKEGFSRRMAKIRGRWRDHERWAILADDF